MSKAIKGILNEPVQFFGLKKELHALNTNPRNFICKISLENSGNDLSAVINIWILPDFSQNPLIMSHLLKNGAT